MSILIKKIAKNKSSFDVTIENNHDTFKIKISEDLLIEEKLFKEGEISKEKFDSIMNKLPKDSILLYSMKYLDKNMKSIKELKDHLLLKTSSLSLIDEVIDILKSKNILNDDIYFERVIFEFISIKRYGPLKIYDELNRRGIYRNFEYPYDDLKENITYHITKYVKKNEDSPYKRLVISTKSYLLSKGFSESNINELFDYSLIKVKDETYLFNKELKRLKEKYNDDTLKIKSSLYKLGFSEDLINKI